MKTRLTFAAACAALAFATVAWGQNAEGGSPVQAENPGKTALDSSVAGTPSTAHKTRRPLNGDNIKLTDMNLQLQYDFGTDRKFVTLTYEMFHPDSWGNTFFFVDLDLNWRDGNGRNVGISGAYTELSRSFNFWRDTCMKDFCLQLEYNGGLGGFNGGSYPINHAFLAGANYTIHTKDYRYLLTFQLLYRKILQVRQTVPMQLTLVWGCQDLFGAKGLRFSGYVDFWNEDHSGGDSALGNVLIIQSEPQVWYSVGQWFGCPHLNVGGEVELSLNFAGTRGFRARPCLGLKWIF